MTATEQNKKTRGQFFTVNSKVQEIMLSLMTQHESWRVLEPSAGSGDLMRAFKKNFPAENIVGWEIDKDVIPENTTLNIEHGDFFIKAAESVEKFHSILGNPPYVAWKNVEFNTVESSLLVKARYGDKCNLYYLFMDRCIDLLEDNGEMIFIQPKEWMYSTSAKPIRDKMLKTGTITHIIDGGEEKVFPDADVPAIMIFRYQKTPTTVHNIQHRYGFLQNVTSWEQKSITVTNNGYWLLLAPEQTAQMKDWVTLGDHFDVKVGIVSGSDKIYNITHHKKKELFILDGTTKNYLTTKGVETFIDLNDVTDFESVPEFTKNYMLSHKGSLITRGIAKFTESNWWRYGAIRNKTLMETNKPRIYTFSKTRSSAPFFLKDDITYFSGGLLALFSKYNTLDNRDEILSFLNSELFREVCQSLGLTTSNKVSFQPSTLEAVPFPTLDYFK